MKRMALLGLLLMVGLTGCLDGLYGTATQFSTLGALAMGLYEGDATVVDVRAAGNFGLGTFDQLDGEMIVLNGIVYQATSDGGVRIAPGNLGVPFATVTRFFPDAYASIGEGLSLSGLTEVLDANLASENLIYAIRIDGVFPYLKIRTVPPQERPYPPLAEVVANQQVVRELEDCAGTLVIFRMPPYIGDLNAKGYHVHFISQDRRHAGHVLGLRTSAHVAEIDTLKGFQMNLPKTADFMNAPLGDAEATDKSAREVPVL